MQLTGFLVLLFTLISLPLKSQGFGKVYYNEYWEMTSMKYAKYYRNSGFDTSLMVFDSTVFDHYINGSIEMTGRYNKGAKDGSFIYYYPDNSLRLISSYKKNSRTDVWTTFFPDGKVHKSVSYSDGKERITALNDENGKPLHEKLTGKYVEDIWYDYGQNKFFDTNPGRMSEKMIIEGALRNGYKDGTWTLKRMVLVSGRNEAGKWSEGEYPQVLCTFRYSNGELKGIPVYTEEGRDLLPPGTYPSLINEPPKITFTEKLISGPSRYIRQNYILDAATAKGIPTGICPGIIRDTEIPGFFQKHMKLYSSNCSDTTTVMIRLKMNEDNSLSVESVLPLDNPVFRQDAERVTGMIYRMGIHSVNEPEFRYKPGCMKN